MVYVSILRQAQGVVLPRRYWSEQTCNQTPGHHSPATLEPRSPQSIHGNSPNIELHSEYEAAIDLDLPNNKINKATGLATVTVGVLGQHLANCCHSHSRLQAGAIQPAN